MHHAGLTLDDRRAVEDLYINKILRVVVATSVRLVFSFRTFLSILIAIIQTLAVGVNLRRFIVLCRIPS